MNPATFELYLLSTMRAKALVDAELTRREATRFDALAAQDAARAMGFETPGHGVALYRSALGTPVAVVPVPLETSHSFHGSVSYHFALPQWPDLAFAVNEHPTGYAWGRGFRRRVDAQPSRIDSIEDLKPWALVSSEVTARFGTPRREDAWSFWEDLVYDVPRRQGEPLTPCLLAFDHDLLQLVTLMEDQ